MKKEVSIMDKFILTLVIIGALNWGCIGLFGYDVIGVLFGGQGAVISRIIYAVVGVAGLWALTFYPKLPSGSDQS